MTECARAMAWVAMVTVLAAGAAEAGAGPAGNPKATGGGGGEDGAVDKGGGGGLEGVVNINTATPEELEMLPGIGPSKAKAIVLYRDGKPFKDPRHLVRVKGIGRAILERILPFLSVTGPTTIKAK